MNKLIITYNEEPSRWLVWLEKGDGRREIIFRTSKKINFQEILKIQRIIEGSK